MSCVYILYIHNFAGLFFFSFFSLQNLLQTYFTLLLCLKDSICPSDHKYSLFVPTQDILRMHTLYDKYMTDTLHNLDCLLWIIC